MFEFTESFTDAYTALHPSPHASSLILQLEAWNLGISVFFVVIRMVTLLITAFIYVARVDIPFLSDSADEVGGVSLQ